MIKRSLFSVSDIADEHNSYLRLFTKIIFVRSIAIYSSWEIYSMFPPTYISCDYCCVTFVSLFISLRHSRDFTSHKSRRGTLYIYIKNWLLDCSDDASIIIVPGTYFYTGNKIQGANKKRWNWHTKKRKKHHPRFEPLTLWLHVQRPTCYPTMLHTLNEIVTYLYVWTDARLDFLTKKQQNPLPRDHASTAEAVPGRVGRDE